MQLSILVSVATLSTLASPSRAQVPDGADGPPEHLGRSSVSGGTEDPFPGISPDAKGALTVEWPFKLPSVLGPILLSPLPIYSSEAGVSRWGKGWSSSLYVELEPARGQTLQPPSQRHLMTPWGRFRTGTDGAWYPVGMGSLSRAVVRPDGGFDFFVPGDIQVVFVPDAREYGTTAVFRWRASRASDQHGNTTHFQWVPDGHGYGAMLDGVRWGLDGSTYRAKFAYRHWPRPFLVGGREGAGQLVQTVVERIDIFHGSDLIETQTIAYADPGSASEPSANWYPRVDRITRKRGNDELSESFRYFDSPAQHVRRVDSGAFLTRARLNASAAVDMDGDGTPEIADILNKRIYYVDYAGTPSITWRPSPFVSNQSCPWNELVKPHSGRIWSVLPGRFDRKSPLVLLGLWLDNYVGPQSGAVSLGVRVCAPGGNSTHEFLVPMNDAFYRPALRNAVWTDIDRDDLPDLVVFGSLKEKMVYTWGGEGPQAWLVPAQSGEVHVFRNTGDAAAPFAQQQNFSSGSGPLLVDPSLPHQIVDFNGDGFQDIAEIGRGACGEGLAARIRVWFGSTDPLRMEGPQSFDVHPPSGHERYCARWLAEYAPHEGPPNCQGSPTVDWTAGFLSDIDGDGLPDYIQTCNANLDVHLNRRQFVWSDAASVSWDESHLPYDEFTRTKALGHFTQKSKTVLDIMYAYHPPGQLGSSTPPDKSWWMLSWGDFRGGLLREVTMPNNVIVEFDYELDDKHRSPLLTRIEPLFKGLPALNAGAYGWRKITYRNAVRDPTTDRLWGFKSVTTCVNGKKPCHTRTYSFDPREEGVPRLAESAGDSSGPTPWMRVTFEPTAHQGVPYRRVSTVETGWTHGAKRLVGKTSKFGYEQLNGGCPGPTAVFDPLSPSSVATTTEQGRVEETRCYRRPARLASWIRSVPTRIVLEETDADGTQRHLTRNFEYWHVGSIWDSGTLKREWVDTGESRTVLGCNETSLVELTRIDELQPQAGLGYPLQVAHDGLAATKVTRLPSAPHLIDSITGPDGRTVAFGDVDPLNGRVASVTINGVEHIHRSYDSRGRLLWEWSDERGTTVADPRVRYWYNEPTPGIEVVEAAERVAPGSYRRYLSISAGAGSQTVSATMESQEDVQVWRWTPMTFHWESAMKKWNVNEELGHTYVRASVAPTPVIGDPGARQLPSLHDISPPLQTVELGWSWAFPSGAGRTADVMSDVEYATEVTLKADRISVARKRRSVDTGEHHGTDFLEHYPSGLVRTRRRGDASATYRYHADGTLKHVDIASGGDAITLDIVSDMAGRVHETRRSDVGGVRRCYKGALVDTSEFFDRNGASYRTERVEYDGQGRITLIAHDAPGAVRKEYRYSWDCQGLPSPEETVGCRGQLHRVSGPHYARDWRYDALGRPTSVATALGEAAVRISYGYDGGDVPRMVTYRGTGLGDPVVFDTLRDVTGDPQFLSVTMGASRLDFDVVRNDDYTRIRAPGGELTRGFDYRTGDVGEMEWFTATEQVKHRIDDVEGGFVTQETNEWNVRGTGPFVEKARHYKYDQNQRLWKVTGSGHTETYRYRPDGRAYSMKIDGTTRIWQRGADFASSNDGFYVLRDAAGRAKTQERSDPIPRTLNYSYGADGLIAAVEEDGRSLEYVYDQNGLYLGSKMPGESHPDTSADGLVGVPVIDDPGLGGWANRRLPVVIAGWTIGWVVWEPQGLGNGKLRFVPLVTDLRGTRILGDRQEQLDPTAFGELTDRMDRARRHLDAAYVGARWTSELAAIRMPMRPYMPELTEFLVPDPLLLAAPESCLGSLAMCFGHTYMFDDVVNHADPTGLQEHSSVEMPETVIGPLARGEYLDMAIAELFDYLTSAWNDFRQSSTEAMFDREAYDACVRDHGSTRVPDSPLLDATAMIVERTPSASADMFMLMAGSMTKPAPAVDFAEGIARGAARPKVGITETGAGEVPGGQNAAPSKIGAGVYGNPQRNTALGHQVLNETAAIEAGQWPGVKLVLINRTIGRATGRKALGIWRLRPDAIAVGEQIDLIEVISPSNSLNALMRNSLKILRSLGDDAGGAFILRTPKWPP